MSFNASNASPEALERFWSLVDKKPGDGCWEWIGGRDADGYGQFSFGAKRARAHRFTLGEIPSGMLACHHCDNRPCVRPDHLFIGNHSDNAQDMVRKGRGPKVVIEGRRVPISLPDDTYTLLVNRAKSECRTLASVIRIALKSHLSKP